MSISRISWDENFQPSDLKIIERDDPFAPLSNAIVLLERDLFEIITDLKHFNEHLEARVLERTKELEIQNVELKKVNSELDSFVYKTSHDLRAPLVSLLGLINITKIEKDQSTKDRYLEMMESAVLKMDGFIKDITEFLRNL